MRHVRSTCSALAIAMICLAAEPAFAQPAAPTAGPGDDQKTDTVVVTARLREENAQDVPISLSVVEGDTLTKTATYNVQTLQQLVPALNYSSANPRNTSYAIRGLGSNVVAIAQSNDGLEPGVGFYIDDVYHARAAAAAFDFTDIESVEVLRGPQGTLFGKNNTAGSIRIASRAPSFTPELNADVSLGEIGYKQARFSASGPLFGDVVAGRLSGAATFRDGYLDNVTLNKKQNDLATYALRGQLLFKLSDTLRVRLEGDWAKIDEECCTQVFVKVGMSLKAADRQYPALAAGLNYTPALTNPSGRKTDINAGLGVDTVDAGVSAKVDWDLGAVTLSSITAWRWWDWGANNDRDYTSIPIQNLQRIPSRQDQYSQEFRIASNGNSDLSYVAGLYAFTQTITGDQLTQYGAQAAYWLLGPEPTYAANLLDGYQLTAHSRFRSDSFAAYGETTWRPMTPLALTAGLRYTYEDKFGKFDSQVSGGAAPRNATETSGKLSIARGQSYQAVMNGGSLAGRVSASWNFTPDVMAYATASVGSKSGGINMSGLPLDASNLPALATAAIKPEKNTTYEIGAKATLFDGAMQVSADVFDTTVKDFQTNVVDTGPGALRGYLANAKQVSSTGAEVESSFEIGGNFSGRFGASYTDAKFDDFTNGGCPIELIAAATRVCDLSGRPLSGLPKWMVTAGGEYHQPMQVGGATAEGFVRFDASYRSEMFGEPTDSRFTVIDGYTLVNASVGLRDLGPWEFQVWARNLFDEDYLLNLTVQAGNSGLIVGTPNEPRMFGVTVRYAN